MKTSRSLVGSIQRSRLKGNIRRLKRTTIIILLIVIHQFSIVHGYNSFICIDHDPCPGVHDVVDTHLAWAGVNLFEPLVGHHEKSNSHDHSGHCACKCPGSEENNHGGSHKAVVSNTTSAQNLVKFSTMLTMFRISAPPEFNLLASDARFRGDESPVSLNALQSVLLLI